MTLQEFIAEEYDRLDAFKRHWDHESAVNPEEYPMAMEPGEWGEQLLAFEVIEGGDS